MPVLSGIIESQRYRRDEAILSLPGNELRDWSWWRNSLSTSSVNASNNSYSLTSTSPVLTTTVNSSLFGLGASDFTLSCEVRVLSFRASNKAVLIGDDTNSIASSNYAWRLNNTQQVEFYYYNTANTLTVFTHNLPDTDYLTSFQALKVQRNSSSLDFYYKNSLLATSSMGVNAIALKPSTGRIRVGTSGSNSTFALNGFLKKVRVLCPSKGIPVGY
ncbi:MAG: hypothetical protein ACRC80_11860 [Waterburya sp.]